MYFSIPSETLAETLRTLKLAICKDRLPILSHALFRVSDDGSTLSVTTTDLDVALTRHIPLTDPGGKGEACIHLPTLAEIKADRKTPVRIDTVPEDHDAQVQYVSGNFAATATAPTLPVADFPAPDPLPPPDQALPFPAKTLRAIAASIPFQSLDQTRYVLQGTYLDPEGHVVATDGRVLAKWKARTLAMPVIIPSRACTILARIPEGQALVSLGFPKGKKIPDTIGLRIGPWDLRSKLIEGNYPNYRQVIPPEGNCHITFADPAAVAKWLTAIPGAKDSRCVLITPRLPHHVDLKSGTSATTAIAHITGELAAVAVNPAYLAKTLAAIPGTLSIIDEMSPVLARIPGALVVLMPMRVNTETKPAKPAAEKTAA